MKSALLLNGATHVLHQGASALQGNSLRSQREDPSSPGFVQPGAWSSFPWLCAGFSTRQGGQSTAYNREGIGEQNLGWTDSDAAETVAQNRKRFLGAVAGQRSISLATVRQIHSGIIHVARQGDGPLAGEDGRPILQGDGLITAEPGLLLGIITADCVPVLVADTRTRAVAAFHAGWRGTLARIVEQGIHTMQLEFGSQPQDLIAAIGPCIRMCCFAVGAEVQTQFEDEFSYGKELFSEPPATEATRQKYMDLQKANRRQLLDAGLPADAISTIAECTACSRLDDGHRKYFSHRAENGFTGRMLSVIGVSA